MRDWAKARRARTHHLIELGGLVQKAGLVNLTNDDRATLLGAFLDLANQLQGNTPTLSVDLRTRWRRAGLKAFDADRVSDEALSGPPKRFSPPRDQLP
ncbi:conjugal transfer protein TraD [Kozakia baliensis]|uniref:conjugal transfer protein TraD n=1 Tax=Kozakia baliensis TaxID=153496 RepID=UPI0009DE87DD|nr:conjugal transfer protein TraD [Kozakia baliensis]